MGPAELPVVGDSRGTPVCPCSLLPGPFNNSVPKEGGESALPFCSCSSISTNRVWSGVWTGCAGHPRGGGDWMGRSLAPKKDCRDPHLRRVQRLDRADPGVHPPPSQAYCPLSMGRCMFVWGPSPFLTSRPCSE